MPTRGRATKHNNVLTTAVIIAALRDVGLRGLIGSSVLNGAPPMAKKICCAACGIFGDYAGRNAQPLDSDDFLSNTPRPKNVGIGDRPFFGLGGLA